MSSRIWAGRCEDCYNERRLQEYNGPGIRNGLSAELCEECIARRESYVGHNHEPPPIGLFVGVEWKDAGLLTVLQGEDRIVISVKYSAEGKYQGIVRLRINDGPKWLPAGCFCHNPILAQSSARCFLMNNYFPNGGITVL